MLRQRLAAAVSALTLLIAGAAAADAPFDRAAWKADFEALKRAQQERYANLAWMASPESGIDLPALNRRTLEALDRAQSDAEARRAILDYVAGFHDGHFSQLVTLEPLAAPAPEPAAPTLDPDRPADGCAALGYASTARVPFSLPFETLPGFQLESDGLATPFRAGILPDPKGGRIGLVRIQNFRTAPFPAACLTGWAVLRKAGKAITRSAVAEAADEAWYAALEAQLRRFAAEGVRVVVVDVGANSGGNDSGDWVPRMFSGNPVRSARLLMTASAPAAAFFDEQIGDLAKAEAKASTPTGKAALAEARKGYERRKAAIAAAHCDMGWVWTERRAWNPKACNNLIDAGFASGPFASLERGAYGDPEAAGALSWPSRIEAHWGAWTGPTYVLANSTSYSSAEMFAARMRDNGIARIVGARTGGDGCGFMTDTAPVVLPHSQLRFRMPNCVRLREDGTDEVAGVAADLPVAPAEGESDRARAMRTILMISGDLAARSR